MLSYEEKERKHKIKEVVATQYLLQTKDLAEF